MVSRPQSGKREKQEVETGRSLKLIRHFGRCVGDVGPVHGDGLLGLSDNLGLVQQTVVLLRTLRMIPLCLLEEFIP